MKPILDAGCSGAYLPAEDRSRKAGRRGSSHSRCVFVRDWSERVWQKASEPRTKALYHRSRPVTEGVLSRKPPYGSPARGAEEPATSIFNRQSSMGSVFGVGGRAGTEEEAAFLK